ncbi:MAG: NADP-dependent oxidoreductase, partial [Aeromicrobium sp.]
MTSATENTRVLLASRPHGEPVAENFRLETTPLPVPGEGEVLLRTIYLSLDPYMRGRMSAAKSYAAPVEVGDVMVGGAVAEVVESRDDSLAVGDIVLAYLGWQTHGVQPAGAVRRIDPSRAPISTALGVLGMPGFTAYAGLLEIGRPQPGETVVVAAAAGPVGSAVGQIARIKGARAVGIAGGPEKVAYLEEIGFDVALDHRSPTFAQDLEAAVPDGIDVYFENVGGHVWDAVLPLLNL